MGDYVVDGSLYGLPFLLCWVFLSYIVLCIHSLFHFFLWRKRNGYIHQVCRPEITVIRICYVKRFFVFRRPHSTVHDITFSIIVRYSINVENSLFFKDTLTVALIHEPGCHDIKRGFIFIGSTYRFVDGCKVCGFQVLLPEKLLPAFRQDVP